MEASGVFALAVALGSSSASAALLGSLACSEVESRVRGVSRQSLSKDLFRVKRQAETLLLRAPRIGVAIERARVARRRNQIRKSLPEVIRLLCISLDSGSSLAKALSYAADNSSGAVERELKTAVWGLKAGQSFDEVMSQLRLRTGGNEFMCLSVAMEIQHRCGGTLSGILEELSSMLQQTSELEDELVTKTTQAQLSARVVALMPLAVLALLSVISPGYLGRFVESAAGIAMLVLAIVLEFVGVLLVRRSLEIDIGMGEG